MIQEERVQDLKNLFLLLSGIPHALTPLRTEFEERVKTQGREGERERERERALST